MIYCVYCNDDSISGRCFIVENQTRGNRFVIMAYIFKLRRYQYAMRGLSRNSNPLQHLTAPVFVYKMHTRHLFIYFKCVL